MKEKVLKIINHYGVMPQLKHFNSEIFELTEAIINYENSLKEPYAVNTLPLREHIAEEIADVMVMLKQFQFYYGIDREELRKVVNYKIDRQLGRIENENK